MKSLYENVQFSTSIDCQSNTGSEIDGSAIDTVGFNTAVLRVRVSAASGSPSPSTVAVKLQECATSNGNFADALDNTGVVIGGTAAITAAAGADLEARIEGLNNLNRKRYLRVVATPTFVGGTTPACIVFGEIVLGRGFELPSVTANSNT